MSDKNGKEFGNQDEAIAYVRGQKMPIVIKTTGMKDGRGVIVCDTHEEAEAAIDDFMRKKILGRAGDSINIEPY